MQHRVHGARYIDVFRDVLVGNLEPGVREQVGDIRISAGDQIVEAKHLPALLDEEIAKMGPKKPGSACDDNAQVDCPLCSVLFTTHVAHYRRKN